jgi:hypothetical protein
MSDLIDIRLIGIPIRIQAEASQHFDELMREFSDLAATDTAAHREVPGRLIALQGELQGRFSAFTQAQETDLADAIARDADTLDLHYRVPADVGEASTDLARILDEADEYCAAGEYLLTLKTPVRPLRYRQWFLAQFIDQAAGGPPVSWGDWAAEHAPDL